ncbi:MAG: hypothetical protein M0C28_34670 [Candidatus Moduliflexus flocculans]|nr:hypothetical protein [Candidatus Moduliflexus flocculans]
MDRVVAVGDGKLASETVRVQKVDGGEHRRTGCRRFGRTGAVRVNTLSSFDIKRRVLIEAWAKRSSSASRKEVIIRVNKARCPGAD